MEFIELSLSGLFLIKPQLWGDERGYFMEVYQAQKFAQAGITGSFVQDNQSSSLRGVLRGMHYQVHHPQGKLVRVISGEIFDVAVDLRQNSPTFGKWDSTILSGENKHQLWVPPGFAHGFYVLSEMAEVNYKVTDYWHPEAERTLLWNDPQVGICWPLITGLPLIMAEKDQRGRGWRDVMADEVGCDPVYL